MNLQKQLVSELSNLIDPDHSKIKEISPQAAALEAKGVFVWLTTVFPLAFEDEFSADHEKYWNLCWSVIIRIREQMKYLAPGLPVPAKFEIADDEWARLLILGRGLGKSATLEAAAVMRGAMLSGGYCLYVCEAQDQAEEHIGNCKILIDHDESRLTEFYPEMAIDSNAVIDGMKIKDASDIFITNCGWICRAKGLNSKLRGLRKGGKRPDDIKIDDIDGVNDSIGVSLNKLKQLTSSVIPTQARRFATLDFGQNLIAENSVMNQIFAGKADALSARTTIGVSNTFERFEEHLDYHTYLDENDGRIKHKILPNAVPSWSGVDIAQAQKFLNDSGLDTFKAEYQNSFEHQQSQKTYYEYNEERHIITWSDFERVFGVRYIPQHWNAGVGSDIGYSKLSLSAWAFVATAAKNSPLPAHYFLYRGLTFEQDSIDDQAEKIWESMFPDYTIGKRHFEATTKFADYPELFRLLQTKPRCAPFLENFRYNASLNKYEPTAESATETDEDKALFYVKQAAKSFVSQIKKWRISHEKTGEQKTLAQKNGIPIHKTKHFSSDSGKTETNHLLRGDYTRPHPFYPDEQTKDANGKPTGLYRLGCPFLFFLVADDQKKAPRDDDGLKIFRQQIANERRSEEKVSGDGFTTSTKKKLEADAGDALRMWAAEYSMPSATDLTPEEKVEETLPLDLQKESIEQDIGVVPSEVIDNRRLARDVKLNFENPLKNQTKKEDSKWWGDRF